MSKPDFKNLDEKVDALIQLCTEMKQENQHLRNNQHDWQTERNKLRDKNQLAENSLKKVLEKLKGLEQGQE